MAKMRQVMRTSAQPCMTSTVEQAMRRFNNDFCTAAYAVTELN
jgi:hypothetical protein